MNVLFLWMGAGMAGHEGAGGTLPHRALSMSLSATRHDAAVRNAQGQKDQAAGVRTLLTSSADKTTMAMSVILLHHITAPTYTRTHRW